MLGLKMKKVICVVMAAGMVFNVGAVRIKAAIVHQEQFMSIKKPEFENLTIVDKRLVGGITGEYIYKSADEGEGEKTETSEVDNYEIEVSTSSGFENTIKLDKSATGLFVIDKVAQGKTYYVRARGYVDLRGGQAGETQRKYSVWVKTKIKCPSGAANKKIKSYKFTAKRKKNGELIISWDKKSFPQKKNVFYDFKINSKDWFIEWLMGKKEMKKRVMVCKDKIFKKGAKIKITPYLIYGKKKVYLSDDSVGTVYISGKTKTFKL